MLEGASYQDELVYDKELEQMQADHPETVTFIPTVSRPGESRNDGWQGASGRANEIVEEQIEKLGI